MLQDHRNRVFHDFRNGACRNLVCTGMLFVCVLIFMHIEADKSTFIYLLKFKHPFFFASCLTLHISSPLF